MTEIEKIFEDREWRKAVAAETRRLEDEALAIERRIEENRKRRENCRDGAVFCLVMAGGMAAIFVICAYSFQFVQAGLTLALAAASAAGAIFFGREERRRG